jgi:hypothetical protein
MLTHKRRKNNVLAETKKKYTGRSYKANKEELFKTSGLQRIRLGIPCDILYYVKVKKTSQKI